MAPRDGFSNITGQRQHSEEQAATFTISGQHDNMLERKRERQIKPLKIPRKREGESSQNGGNKAAN